MPRRKRTFIHRANAQTFQLVHQPTADEPNRHVLLSKNSHSPDDCQLGSLDSGRDPIASSSQLDETYKSHDFELGEYGFPDDGYDYSQHFRAIGGGGGVFIDAYTGLPNPDAVARPSSSGPPSKNKREESTGLVTLRSSDDETSLNEHGEKDKKEDWRAAEDVLMRETAIQEIRRARRHHEDLEDVFAALDSDGELESNSSEHNDNVLDQKDEKVPPAESAQSESELLEDDFILKADVTDTSGANKTASQRTDGKSDFHGVQPKFREPRLLDAQFEEFMRKYDLESSETDEEFEDLRRVAQRKSEGKDEAGTILALLAENEKEALGFDAGLDDKDLISEFSGLQLDKDVSDGDESHSHSDDESSRGIDESNHDTRGVAPLAGFVNTEFEQGMDGLLESYARVPVQEALHAVDGMEGVRLALLRQESEERSRLEQLDELGIESDGHDSDLDTLFDEMYKEKGEQWDCETILTTYSNLENHPSIIDAPVGRSRKPSQPRSVIRLDPRTQAPAEFMPTSSNQGPSSAQAVDYGSRRDVTPSRSVRPKDESKNAKKARKAAVKEAARERRLLKSEMKKAFGAENLQQGKHSAALGNAKVAVKF